MVPGKGSYCLFELQEFGQLLLGSLSIPYKSWLWLFPHICPHHTLYLCLTLNGPISEVAPVDPLDPSLPHSALYQESSLSSKGLYNPFTFLTRYDRQTEINQSNNLSYCSNSFYLIRKYKVFIGTVFPDFCFIIKLKCLHDISCERRKNLE